MFPFTKASHFGYLFLTHREICSPCLRLRKSACSSYVLLFVFRGLKQREESGPIHIEVSIQESDNKTRPQQKLSIWTRSKQVIYREGISFPLWGKGLLLLWLLEDDAKPPSGRINGVSRCPFVSSLPEVMDFRPFLGLDHFSGTQKRNRFWAILSGSEFAFRRFLAVPSDIKTTFPWQGNTFQNCIQVDTSNHTLVNR